MTPCHLPLVALAEHETCPRCGRPAREHRGHPSYQETTMTEPTEPTREQIEKRIAQLEALVRFPQYAAIWDTDLVVYRMALRTLDAEAQLAERDRYIAEQRAITEPSVHDLARQLREATERACEAEATLDIARKVHASFPGSPLASEVIDGQARRLEEMEAKLAAMTERAEKAETLLDESNATADSLRVTVSILETDARAIRDAATTHAVEFMRGGETAAPAIERMATALREANERAEKAERLAAALRVVAEHEVADAIVKSRERATRIGWIDHATGDYEERAVTMLMDDLAAGSAVCAFLRMVGVWALEDRAEKAERERGATSAALNDLASGLRDALGDFPMVGEKWTDAVKRLRAKLAEVERERDEEHRERVSEANVSAVRYAMIHEEAKNCHGLIAVASLCELLRYDAAECDRAEARARLAAMHRRAQLAENPTTHVRCEVAFQRKRAEWWRGEAKRLGWTPDYPELREDPPSDARIDCESSSLLLLSTWARRVMMREKNRAKGVPSESIRTLLWMARDELFEAYSAIEEDAPTDYILAELGDAAAIIGFAMREIESQRDR